MTNWFTYCPNCGASTLKKLNDNGQQCHSCRATHYHHDSPCVGALIVKDDKVLLTKRAKAPFKGWWDVPGGFVNPGEHPVEALKREMKEELEIKITATQFLNAYPDVYGNHTGYGTLNMHFICTLEGNPKKIDTEIAELKWFPLTKLPKKIAFANGQQAVKDLKKFKERKIQDERT